MTTTVNPTQQRQLATEHDLYTALLERDPRVDGRVFYGITSTGIYCRPTCPARKPLQKNVRFFLSADAAERAGFRACRRCHPRQAVVDPRMAIVERVVSDVGEHLDGDCSLQAVAERVGASAAHLHRTFKAMLGITLKGYVDARRLEHVRGSLRSGRDVTNALYDAGFGSSRALYERSNATLGMTPGAYRAGGEQTEIRFTVTDSPLGKVLVARTDAGICSVTLGDDGEGLSHRLREEFPAASIREDRDDLAGVVDQVLARIRGNEPERVLPLDVRATAFQRRVWEELQKIPRGTTRTYAEIARAIDRPEAVRAVAGACAANPVAIVVPCHRVVRSDGGHGGYRWGIERKATLLAAEQSSPE